MKESTYKKIIDAVTKDKRIPGAKAIIRNTSAGGEVIIEGIATLKKELYHGRWIVRFPGIIEMSNALFKKRMFNEMST